MLAHYQPLTEEDKVELAALGSLRKAHVGLELGELGMIRVPPGNRVPHALQEHTQMQLLLLTHMVLLTMVRVGVNGTAYRLAGRGRRRCSRRVRPVYACRKRPRRCNSGTRLRVSSSSPSGSVAGSRWKPSVACASNHCSSRSASCVGVPTKRKVRG